MTIGRVWRRARQAAFIPEVAASPLARTPYDLRHAAVSTWLNGGVPPTTVAEWAGHSVEVLLRIYAKCLDGGDALVRRRVEAAVGYADTDVSNLSWLDPTGTGSAEYRQLSPKQRRTRNERLPLPRAYPLGRYEGHESTERRPLRSPASCETQGSHGGEPAITNRDAGTNRAQIAARATALRGSMS
jgi:hypothetical protein